MNTLASITSFPSYQAPSLAPGASAGVRGTAAGNSAKTEGSLPVAGAAPSSPTSGSGDETGKESRKSSSAASSSVQNLSPEQLKQLSELKARDREVRAHEAAHQAVGGQYAGAISYTFQRGPDGAQYAVGGEVSIDVSAVGGDPQATIEKMRVVRAAALAPAEPSGQDRAVAAQAMQTMLQAQAELASEFGAQEPESESEQERSGPAEGPGERSRPGEQARETYQSVSAMVAPEESRPSMFAPVFA